MLERRNHVTTLGHAPRYVLRKRITDTVSLVCLHRLCVTHRARRILVLYDARTVFVILVMHRYTSRHTPSFVSLAQYTVRIRLLFVRVVCCSHTLTVTRSRPQRSLYSLSYCHNAALAA